VESGNGLSQDFQGAVGQVAGGNIYNFYNSKPTRRVNNDLRRAIGELLKICDPCGQRKLIEKISFQCFKTTDFKSLEVDQVRSLIAMAKDIAEVINNAKQEASKVKSPWWKLRFFK
jgi:hypothetical protein